MRGRGDVQRDAAVDKRRSHIDREDIDTPTRKLPLAAVDDLPTGSAVSSRGRSQTMFPVRLVEAPLRARRCWRPCETPSHATDRAD